MKFVLCDEMIMSGHAVLLGATGGGEVLFSSAQGSCRTDLADWILRDKRWCVMIAVVKYCGANGGALMKNAVLLSGGLDSATVLTMARQQGFRCHALRWLPSATCQLAHQTRGGAGRAEHQVIHIDLTAFGGSALTDSNIAVPEQELTASPDLRAAPQYHMLSWPGLPGAQARDISLVSMRWINAIRPNMWQP
jgi:hypothetical protein